MKEDNDMMNSNQDQTVDNKQELDKIESLENEPKTEVVSDKEVVLPNENPENIEAMENIVSSSADSEIEKEEEKTSKEEVSYLPDFNKLSLEDLVSEANKIINSYEFGKSKKIIDIIKNTFYSKLNTEQEEHKKRFLEEGGKKEDYQIMLSPHEETFKELIKIFKTKRATALAENEKQKEANYIVKIGIIDDITSLLNSTEHFNTVYHKFKELQNKWKEINQIPSSKIKELNSKYQFALNQFYDYLKINKELRELDLKKNQEQKEDFCKKAEALIDSTNAKSAFIELQDLHQRWKDVGPVVEENREALWERFKNATKSINDKFQDYQAKQRTEREANLVKKTAICEQVEEALEITYTSPKEWDNGSNTIIDLQKEWRKIGMVPSKNNDEVYGRFKQACDQFFKLKNDYFKGLKSQQKDNMSLKIKLIEKVELLKDNEDWENTKKQIIEIQKQWRQIGPVPRKKSDAIWKRFRSACDDFFNKKDAHFKELHGDEKENLKGKEALIKQIEAYQQKEDVKESIKDLKAFQDQWASIGFVPIKNKNDIQEAYRIAINNQFDALNIDAKERDLARLQLKLDQYIESPNAQKLIFGERNKLVIRIKKAETDIQQLENNIGFFSLGTAKGLLKEYENKIEVNKKNLEALREKVKLIDKYIED